MKYITHRPPPAHRASHPARGAWIEMRALLDFLPRRAVSHPARGAWIEIVGPPLRLLDQPVAPRKGCVD